MRNKRHWCALAMLVLCIATASFACIRHDKAAHNGKTAPTLAVSILPQAWFVSRISGGQFQILVLVGPGQNPHNYEPTPSQINDLSRVGAWILSGAEFEISLRPKIERLFPALPLVDGTAGAAFRKLEAGDHAHHGDPASGNEIDRHTWLGPGPAKILATHIRDTLCALDQAGAHQYEENYQALVIEIDAEFAILRQELAPLKGKNVFVYHPSFGYFLDEFGIRQEAVETGGKSPSPRDLQRLIALAKEEQPAAIFVQAQFPVTAAKTVADAVGAQLISLDPLAPDWLANIQHMGEALRMNVE